LDAFHSNEVLHKGRLSELFGEVSLETDRIVRTIGFLRRARKDIFEFTGTVFMRVLVLTDGRG
jgi:acyl-homoserine lactone acylase PvdQ